MESQKYAIVDLETTGHSPKNGDRIIQIAIVIMRDWQIEKQFTTFIDPGQAIPPHITDLTQITDADVCYAMPFEAHADMIYELLEDCVFVAHNVDFDLNFLQQEFKRVGLAKWQGRFIDTVELAKIVLPTSLSFKLGDLAADLNIPLAQAHRADEDAKATAYLLAKCYEEILCLPQTTIEQLHKRAFRLKSNIAHLLFDALRYKRQRHETRTDIMFYGRLAIQKEQPLDALTQLQTAYPKNVDDKKVLLKRAFPKFEERAAQFDMMDVIWQAMEQREECVIEASTGIGKSLAYLLPAVLYAKKERKKIGISTYTSYLQEQLLHEEIPKIEQVLNTKIHVALLKGMQHYIDLERVTQMLRTESESYDETLALLQVLVWLTKTQTGDVNELTVSGGGQLVLERLRKSGAGQPTAVDYYDRALKNSRDAEVIITNHAMLLADTTRQTPLYQNIGAWVVDEAHQMVQAAIQQDERLFHYTNWKYILGQIGTAAEHQLFRKLYKRALKTRRVSMTTLVQTEKSYVRMMRLFEEAVQQIVHALRLTEDGEAKETIFLHNVTLPIPLIEQARDAMIQWLTSAKDIAHYLTSGTEPLVLEDLYLLNDWQFLIRELTIKVAEWEQIFLYKNNNYTTWLEIDKRSVPGSLQVMHKPLHVQQTMQQLFAQQQRKIGIVWTSGTLTVPHNERYIANQLGIHKKVPIHCFQAPPNYYAGAKMFVVTDMPDVQMVSQTQYVEAIAKGIIQTVQQTEGRSFVLFTSQQMLKATVQYIQEQQALSDYMLFAQGVTGGSRMRLLKAFQKFQRSVLFGTNSFWEGVDVPGDALSAVIVVRLPFSSPEEPIFKSRAEAYTRARKNAFTELALPEAVMRFKQGFGRLIRSSQDRGVFIVLDRRIESKSYGKEFIAALPPIDVKKLSLHDMVLALEHWYNNER